MLGAFAVWVRSDLDIPDQAAKFMSLYLLFAIGFKGGVAISESTFDVVIIRDLVVAMVLSAAIPLYVFFWLRRSLSAADAAATAATYGSVSAVTFVTSIGYLDAIGVEWSGYMVAAMALMESPAIVAGLVLYSLHNPERSGSSRKPNFAGLLRESLVNGSVLLILGSLVAGWLAGPAGMVQVSPFIKSLFIGVLCLFLLDMGIVAARRIRDMTANGGSMIGFKLLLWGLSLPLINAAIGLFISWLLGMNEGNSLLLVVLCASASYIAVPAAMRLSLPQANPSVYLPMSLAITFPFNLIVGIPLYHKAVNWLL